MILQEKTSLVRNNMYMLDVQISLIPLFIYRRLRCLPTELHSKMAAENRNQIKMRKSKRSQTLKDG